MTVPSNASIVVRPATPQAFDHRDFEELTLELVKGTGIMADAIEYRLGYLYGNGLVDWTVIEFVLDEAGREAIAAVVGAILAWGKAWLRKRKDERPIKAILYGPDGDVIREVEVERDE